MSSTLSSLVIAPRFNVSGIISYGYADVEITPIPIIGGIYFNVVLGSYRFWNGATWNTLIGSSGGIFTGPISAPSITDTSLTAGNCIQASLGGLLVTTGSACGSSGGSVTVTGSPVSGNITVFSGGTSITNATAAQIVAAVGSMPVANANAVPASGIVGTLTNLQIANPATTVNGQTCTLGSTCTVTASATTLTGIVPVTNGGTGAASGTGYVYGNGTSPFTFSTTIPYTAITGGPSDSFSAITSGINTSATMNVGAGAVFSIVGLEQGPLTVGTGDAATTNYTIAYVGSNSTVKTAALSSTAVFGVAMNSASAGGTVYVCNWGQCPGVAGNNWTTGDFLTPSATTPGALDDTGQVSNGAICQTVQIWGRALNATTTGNVGLINTVGAGHFGTLVCLPNSVSGILAVANGGTGVTTPIVGGIATLSSGSVTITNTAACTASSTCIYHLSNCGLNGTTAVGVPGVGTINPGTSFVINSYTALAAIAVDTSKVCWSINP
jgi:hypothetical protein